MMEEPTQALTTLDAPLLSIGARADQEARQTLLAEYQSRKSAQTLRRQQADIALLERFLTMEQGSSIAGMYADLAQWHALTWGLVEKFCRWQLLEGYAVGSINVRLATIKAYCKLAAKGGYFTTNGTTPDEQRLPLILAVKGYNHSDGMNVDQKRKNANIPTRKSSKKARPTPLKPAHVELLKQQPATFQGSRDRLIICLMFDHALRCGEVAALDVQDIRLDPALGTGTLHIHSIKIKGEHEAALTPDTYDAALAYLAYLPGNQEPLFVGKISKERIDERSIYHRVQLLGRRIGLTLDISPHDGRHFFVDDALNPENENSLAAIQQAGRWKSPAMVMRYATEKKIINEGLKLTATRKRGEA